MILCIEYTCSVNTYKHLATILSSLSNKHLHKNMQAFMYTTERLKMSIKR